MPEITLSRSNVKPTLVASAAELALWVIVNSALRLPPGATESADNDIENTGAACTDKLVETGRKYTVEPLTVALPVLVVKV
ncbi:hypothetical protein MACH26_31250 [Planctobacterium marinum]|uniref:Uncharacterized protein n=1 Tax=Planctobacterium marinum TaxID=1631968 RepID=A0AA48HTC3_9ALTE|nr:hypothetical protein MACH26_31250 [Planctobacterium marinum]